MTNLPDLPKQHKQKEADFGVYLKQYVEKHAQDFSTCSLELKHTHDKDRLPFSAVKAEQLAYANRVTGKGAWIRVQGIGGEPDYIWMKGQPSYIVIKYPKFFCFITSGNFIFESENSKSKSLTAERAMQIATKIVPL